LNPGLALSSCLGFAISKSKSDGCIFYYHGIVEKKTDLLLERNFHLLSDFRQHLEFLKHFTVKSLSELSSLSSNERRPWIAITFDDGYANNLAVAEMLAKYRMPWSVFISTAAIGTQRPIWTIEVSLLCLYGQAKSLDIMGKIWPIEDRVQREMLFQSLRQSMKKMASGLRRETMDSICSQFPQGETERILNQFPSLKMLNWADIKRLCASGVGIGSHGVEHELHHEKQPSATRISELLQSKRDIETHLGKTCDYFAFPNGDYASCSAEELKTSGYKLGFTTEPNKIQGAQSILIPRMPASMKVWKLARQVLQ